MTPAAGKKRPFSERPATELRVPFKTALAALSMKQSEWCVAHGISDAHLSRILWHPGREYSPRVRKAIEETIRQGQKRIAEWGE